MNQRLARTTTRRGQTLIIALLVLGVLLGIGLVFAALLSRNISQTGRSLQRTQAGDLADAGIRFAHTQMLYSELGADWRPEVTLPATDVIGVSRDPDALYLRPGSARPLSTAANSPLDRGGPDGLGPFSRVNFSRGRALVRVLYLPGDFDAYRNVSGAVRQSGKARNFVRIEAIGRVGAINPNDPTTLAAQGYKVTNFVSDVEFRDQLGRLRQIDTRNNDQKKLIAFASVGLVEHARFITNKYQVNRPAELGSLTTPTGANTSAEGMGITHEGQSVEIPTLLGGTLFDASGNTLSAGTGSIFSNADVVVHGTVQTVLNPALGDAVQVAGTIKPANSSSELTLSRVNPNGTITNISLTGGQIDSNSNAFGTQAGLLRDGTREIDGSGYPRSVGRKEPPSFLGLDPATGLNRYFTLTRDSGQIVNGRQSGRFGYGRGVYISASDRSNLSIESDREASDPARSLPKDWLNPNNPNSIAWKGPFYIPVASYVQLNPFGFSIVRDARSSSSFQRTWRRPDGSDSGQSEIRFLLRTLNVGGQFVTYSLNSIASPAIFNAQVSTIPDTTFTQQGQEFNGVLMFEGDVRIRGVIPTDHQITLASQGSIYIEGSITKGVLTPAGTLLTRPSRSMLMLMAKDYVAVNTTMFFGPVPGSTVQNKAVNSLPNTPNPIELIVGANERLRLQTEFILNPSGAGSVPNPNPVSWVPYSTTYRDPNGAAVNPFLVLNHAADDNGPSFINLFVESWRALSTGTPTSSPYLFQRNANFNAAAGGEFSGAGPIPVYGLALPGLNTFANFESMAVPFVDSTFTSGGGQITNGQYSLALQDPSVLDLGLTSLGLFASKNYALARVAMNPHDVRIEAAMFAEEGSFFVIPGPTFNVNANDSRQQFDNDVTSLGLAGAQLRRYNTVGALPGAPFYGEPLNVRVNIIGSITENMPAPIGEQAEWQRKWGWMPRNIPGTDVLAPDQHVPANWPSITGAVPAITYLPNLTLSYDPALALGSADGVTPTRFSRDGLWALPPMPRLPVSPRLAYFGEQTQ